MQEPRGTLVLGLGNTLMGDEGVGVRVVELLLEGPPPPPGVTCLDGGTGSLVLLEPMQGARRLLLVDASADGHPPGTVRRIIPRFASDFPPSLSAHDIGLRDLLDSFYLLGESPEVVLYAISIPWPQELGTGIAPEVEAGAAQAAAMIREEWAS
ncbi:MAG: hydrogenase maturation protease [Acidobacteria bacterium]|nr:hydrogenase maturation protease [Acidobacteriota bacterium]